MKKVEDLKRCRPEIQPSYNAAFDMNRCHIILFVIIGSILLLCAFSSALQLLVFFIASFGLIAHRQLPIMASPTQQATTEPLKMSITWKIRGTTIITVLCCIVCAMYSYSRA